MIPMANVDILWAVTKSNLGCIFPTKNGIRPEKYLDFRIIKVNWIVSFTRSSEANWVFCAGRIRKKKCMKCL